MTLAVRSLPGPYDPPPTGVTVATPTCGCCCCCCCCLVTVSATAAFTTRVVAREHAHSGGANTTALGLLAVPAGLAASVWTLSTGWGADAPIFTGPLVFALVFGVALRMAGAPARRSVTTALSTMVLGIVAFLVEIPAALFSGFLFELLFPVGAWVGLLLAKGYRSDPPPPTWPTDAGWSPPADLRGFGTPPAPGLPAHPPAPPPAPPAPSGPWTPDQWAPGDPDDDAGWRPPPDGPPS